MDKRFNTLCIYIYIFLFKLKRFVYYWQDICITMHEDYSSLIFNTGWPKYTARQAIYVCNQTDTRIMKLINELSENKPRKGESSTVLKEIFKNKKKKKNKVVNRRPWTGRRHQKHPSSHSKPRKRYIFEATYSSKPF